MTYKDEVLACAERLRKAAAKVRDSLDDGTGPRIDQLPMDVLASRPSLLIAFARAYLEQHP